MRLVFTKLETPLKNILVDLGNGKYEEFEVNDLKESSSAKYIQLPDTIPANLIRVKANSTEIDSLNMIKDYMITDDEGNVLGSWSLTAGTSTGVLSANETRYNYEVLDKYKPAGEDTIFHIVLSDTAEFKFDVYGTSNYLENNNGQRYEFENAQIPGMYLVMFMIVHNNILYTIVSTFDDTAENILSAELRKINMNNMTVEYSINVSEYFAGYMEEFLSKITYLPAMNGNILSEDKPVIAIANTNKYIDLVSGDILTRDQNFATGYTYYLSKTDTWYELPGNFGTEAFWTTNNKYTSIEDAALIDTPYLDENDNYIFDAPVLCILDNIVKWTNSGVVNELSVGGKGFFYRDENNNKIFIAPGQILFNDVELDIALYNNYCYVVNKYINITPYQVEKVKIDKTQANFTDVPITAETITINDKATIEDIETSTIDAEDVKTINAEINGMIFYEGEWYHKRMSTKAELLDFIKNNTEDKNFKILFEGSLRFSDEDFPEFIYQNVTGTYQIYKKDISSQISLSFDDRSLENSSNFFRYNIYFYNFKTRISYFSINYIDALHLNNCELDIVYSQNIIGASSVTINCYNMNNVDIDMDEIPSTKLYIDIHNSTNVSISNIHQPNDPLEICGVDMYNSDRCYVKVKADTLTFKQSGAGGNVVIKDNGGTLTQVQPTWQLKYSI